MSDISDRFQPGSGSGVVPRESAAVILARDPANPASGGELEFFLLRRSSRSGFMASAFVFPGGIAEPEDAGDLRITAARELFEEAGILLASPVVDQTLDENTRLAARARVAAGENAQAVLAEHHTHFDVSMLTYFSHWLTPSAEKRRYSAQFFVAKLPRGQHPQFDNVETVDQTWVTAEAAIKQAGKLHLPPPQLRTFYDLLPAAHSWSLLCEEAQRRGNSKTILLPRFAPLGSGAHSPDNSQPNFALLLPWDPDYDRLGVGEGISVAPNHPVATGPSRFVLENETWKHIDAPASSTTA